MVRWSFANITARDSHSYVSADIGGVAQVGSAAPFAFYVLSNNTGPAWVTLGASAGEANTASNVNVGGVGVWKQKAGVDLEFRGINAASSRVTVALDAANNEIDVDVADASTTQAGAIEIATQAEVDAGTDTARAVVPATLAGWSGGASVFGASYQYAEDLSRSTTTSTTYQTKVSLTTPALTGTFRLGWHCVVDQDNTQDKVEVRLQNTTDAATVGPTPTRIEPKDTTNRYSAGGFGEVVFSGAAKTFEVQFRQQGGNTAGIQDARIEIWRVS